MNSISLSEEQKEKLLKMSRKLISFEKPKKVFYSIESITFSKHGLMRINFYVLDSAGLCEGSRNEEIIIHWFEFCMTHLPPKLYGNSETHAEALELIKFHTAILINYCHPVDYLYEQFKTLKK